MYKNNNYVTQQQRKDLAIIRKEYVGVEIPYCKTYVEAEAVINKFKYEMKGLRVPPTRSQREVMNKLKTEYGVKIPYNLDRKKAAELIDEYDKLYHILHNRRLAHYHEEYKEYNVKTLMSTNQFLVIEGLRVRYGDDIIPDFKSRKEVWNFISQFQEVIYINENGFYIDNVNVNIQKLYDYAKPVRKPMSNQEKLQKLKEVKARKKIIKSIEDLL